MPTGDQWLMLGQFVILVLVWLELRDIGRTLKRGTRR